MTLPFVRDLFLELERHPGFQAVVKAILERSSELLQLSGLGSTARAIYTTLLYRATGRTVLLLVDSNKQAEAVSESIETTYRLLYSERQAGPLLLPALDILPYDGLSPHPDITERRAIALWRLASEEAANGRRPLILIAPIGAALMRLESPEFYRNLACRITRGEDMSLDLVLEELERVGYQRHDPVEMVGQYAVRGGILDAYSPESARPIRIEFFGDQVESLRQFDIETQRSVMAVEEALLLPLAEHSVNKELPAMATGTDEALQGALGPGWEFLAPPVRPLKGSLVEMLSDPLVVFHEKENVAAASRKLWERLEAGHARQEEGAGRAAPPAEYYWQIEEWERQTGPLTRVSLEELSLEPDGQPFHILTQPTTRFQGNMPQCMRELESRMGEGFRAVFFGASAGEVERLADIFNEYGVAFQLGLKDPSSAATRYLEEKAYLAGEVSSVTLLQGAVRRGAVFPETRLAVYGSDDLFEVSELVARPQPARSRLSTFLSDFQDLKPGDYVVHVEHGIGCYRGMQQIAQDGRNEEFMLLEYADNARLYVPLSRLDLVQKYRAPEGGRPSLDRLGGTTWNRTKTRIKARMRDMAEELLRLYAERKLAPGFRYSPDSNWQREFEDAFEFAETEDQITAIRDIKRDMESEHPMDRLVCGDVGFGKTEVAMRATFKVLGDGKQVAVLAPTTVLTFQHFETFKQRFAPFPVQVEMLSRFRTPREIKHVLEGLAQGKVDIVIGTHRLLSKDVVFRDLGLLVVDEEQRFGVRHKERLKQLSKGVEVLTLSATPIPRTLHMSLIGLRDMSVIETAPKDRLSIQTVVAPYADRLVRTAIEQELSRGGQVYFIHNRVDSIWSIANLAQQLVPQARIGVGHGQMEEKELEKVMLRFMRREYDILVSTSIVENGLDIPLANTIVINNADRFGLSELYQLRGRVGRSSRRAYAYLLVSQDAELSPLAKKRLAALREFSELGAGFKIAALDLELRGAGNLLGGEQHGHIAAVGFEMYCRLLENTVRELRGEQVIPAGRASINLHLDIRIPPDYIPEENQRLRTYKRVAEVESEEEREKVRQELKDRYGSLPEGAANLLEYAGLKMVADRMLVDSIDRRHDRVSVKFNEGARVDPQKLMTFVGSTPGAEFTPAGVLKFPLDGGPAAQTIAQVKNLLRRLQA
ncbi:MAG: transcription-repair coupling factor [Acidobacteria bacterium]|nr:transcription-repair coupling factor [Acidobacteriota bacterium]